MKFNLMTVFEVSHRNKYGEILFEKYDLKNILHSEGEEYILKTLFTNDYTPIMSQTGLPTFVVTSYYMGLDNRSSLTTSDSLVDIEELETIGTGYRRQEVNKSSFQIVENSNGNYQANSPIIQFNCSGGSWTAKNIFLATSYSSLFTGPKKVISSVPLGSTLVISNGETVSMRIGLALKTSND